jgi:hypothetical protein
LKRARAGLTIYLLTGLPDEVRAAAKLENPSGAVRKANGRADLARAGAFRTISNQPKNVNWDVQHQSNHFVQRLREPFWAEEPNSAGAFDGRYIPGKQN